MRKALALTGAALVLAASACAAMDPGPGGAVLKVVRGGGEIMTNEKIILLVGAGISDELIVRMIGAASRTQFDLTTEGVLKLAEAGVSEDIIQTMMEIWDKQKKIHDQNIRIYIQMLRTDRQDEYDLAVRQFVSYGAYAVPLLIENLTHEDERIRAGASEVLGRIGDPVSLDALFQALVDRNKAVRARAAQAVSVFDKSIVAPKLAAGIERRGLPRDGFALALGYIGDVSYLPAVLDLADDPGAQTDRAAAAYALGLLGDPRVEVVEVLKEAVLNDAFRELREAASRALGRLAPRMAPGMRTDVTMALVSAMKRFPVGREVLALQLRHFPTRRAVEALLEQLGARDKGEAGAAWETLKAITGELIPQDPDQWRSWWAIAKVQPRWREAEAVSRAGPVGPAEPEALPEIPDFIPAESNPFPAQGSAPPVGYGPREGGQDAGGEDAAGEASGGARGSEDEVPDAGGN